VVDPSYNFVLYWEPSQSISYDKAVDSIKLIKRHKIKEVLLKVICSKNRRLVVKKDIPLKKLGKYRKIALADYRSYPEIVKSGMKRVLKQSLKIE
jgi:hypothetical protein